jgi:adenosine/AMP kinase
MSKTGAEVEAAVMIERVEVNNPEEKQVIIGQGNFSIFACDDLFKTLLTTVPALKCAVAMNEAVPRLINVLTVLKSHPAVANIFVASANPLDVIVAETELGRAVLGAVDGTSANRIETAAEKKERRELCETLGYVAD